MAPLRRRHIVLLSIVVTLSLIYGMWWSSQPSQPPNETGPRPTIHEGEGLESARTAHIYDRTYRSAEEAQQAIVRLSEQLRQYPDSSMLWYNRGNAYSFLEQWDQAIVDYTKALRFQPDDSWMYVNRGLAYQKHGELQLALMDFTRAIELSPTWANAYANRGWIYIYLHNPDKAVPDFQTAVRLDPENPFAFNGLGVVYVMTGRPQQAVDAFGAALNIKPPAGREQEYETIRGETYNNRAAAYFNLQEYEKSRNDVQQAQALGVQPAAGLLDRLDRVQSNRY